MKKLLRSFVFFSFLFFFGTGTMNGQMICKFDVVAALSTDSNGQENAEIFAATLIENHQEYTDLEVSTDNVNFGPSITFTCADLGVNVYYARGMKNGDEESCTGDLEVIDNTPPVIVSQTEIYVYPGTTITVEDVDLGSYDNCGILSQTLSQTSFPYTGTYEVDYMVEDLDNNVNTLIVTVQVNSWALACNDMVFISLDANGEAMLTPEDVLENWPYNPEVQIYNEETEEGGDFVPLDCDDIGTFVYEVVDPATGNTCWGNIVVEDKLKPIPYAQNLSVSLNGGNSVSITPEDVDAGSFDNCEIESMTLSQSTFTANGTYTVDFTIVDPSGNSDYATILITVTDGLPTCNQSMYISLDAAGMAEVAAENFIEGNASYDVMEVSLDNVNFGPTVSFDCSDVGSTLPVYVHIEEDGNEYECTSEAMIEDKLPPIAIAKDFTINLDTDTDTYTLEVEDVDNGSTDNCDGLTFELSKTDFDADDWGHNSVELTVTDIQGQSVSAQSSVIVLIDGEAPLLSCIEEITVYSDSWGAPMLWVNDFVSNVSDFTSVGFSMDPAGPFVESLIPECTVEGEGPSTLYIQALLGQSVYECQVALTVIDETSPVVVTKVTIYVTLINGEVTIQPEDVDNGSYDACSDITMDLDKSTFTTEDIGENTVFLTVTDANGNYNSGFATVVVGDGEGCEIENIIFPDNLNIFDENGTEDNLSVENLQSIYGYTFQEVHPYTISECDDLFYSHADYFIEHNLGVKLLRTWTAVNWNSLETTDVTQLIKLYTSYSTALACNDQISVSLQDGPVTIWPSDVLEGGPYDFDNMSLEIIDADENIVVDNLITEEYLGQTLTYEVTDSETNNSCWGTLVVDDTQEGCLLDEDDLTFPLPEIFIPDFDIEPTTLSPEELQENYGFEWTEVMPTWPDDECLAVAAVYEDVVIDYEEGSYKILRTFTVVDWYAFEEDQSTWTFVQVIKTGIDPEMLICDTLARTAPIGDCDSGHTLDDDVEWPADLEIADYRITPAELVEYSMVDVLDSEPSFYNNPDNYEASYINILHDINSTTLTLKRAWTVEHTVYDFTWLYDQTIVVDFSEFQNLVNVSTGTERAMPGVLINTSISTDMQGDAYVDATAVNSITYDDDYLNGINILDLVFMQRHVLGSYSFSDFQASAADVNEDDIVSTVDLVQLRKNILGITAIEKGEWSFYEKEIDSPLNLEPKGIYTAIKTGDVDDSALLEGEDPQAPESKFEALDILLNKGESYEVPVYLKDAYSVAGVEFRTQIDPDLMKVVNITSEYAEYDISYHVTEEGELVFILMLEGDGEEMGGSSSDPVFTIEVEAQENSLLSLSMNMEEKASFLATSDLELVVLGGEIGNTIGTGTNSVELSTLSVYPNPASLFLKFDRSNVALQGDMSIALFGANGQLILNEIGKEIIDVSELAAGMYYYRINIGDHATTGRVLIAR